MPRFYPKECEICGKHFLGWNNDSRFCCRQCFWKSRFRKPKRIPEKLATVDKSDNIAVSVEDILGTYSSRMRKMAVSYPEIMKARSEGRRIQEIEREFGVSDSLVSYYARKSMSPLVYKMLKSCKWLPLKKSKDLDFIVNYAHDHGHIHKKLNMAKIWCADSYELKRVRQRFQRVVGKRFAIRKDRRIYVIYTDSLTARALHSLGVPVGRKMGGLKY